MDLQEKSKETFSKEVVMMKFVKRGLVSSK
jgi:hypothetical protein